MIARTSRVVPASRLLVGLTPGLACGLALGVGACGAPVVAVDPDPRIGTVPLVGEKQGTPPVHAVKDEPLALPGGAGPRMSDGEAASAAQTDPTELAGPGAAAPAATSPEMTFFVTSTGNGEKGGDLGGLAGADAICQRLGDAAGGPKRAWRAYLSTATENARERIGRGPWRNAQGKQVSSSPAELARSGVPGPLVLDERGGRIDARNAHDVFTGSKPDGTFAGASCKDWTSRAAGDKAMVGHADAGDPMNKWDHWSSTHETHGCDAASLQNTAGRGHLYCFARE